MTPSNKKLLSVAGCAIVLLLVLVICSLALNSLQQIVTDLNKEPEPVPFSVEGWNSSRYDENGSFSYTRYRMVNDLLMHYDLHGWSMTAVEKLRNEPDKEADEDSQHVVYYDLGNGLDFLILEIDAESRVVDYRVHRH